MPHSDNRNIPFNDTSADDSQVVRLLIGDEGFQRLQKSRPLNSAGPALHPLMRFFGDLFMLRRNPFVRNDLIASPGRQQRFFEAVGLDLAVVSAAAHDHPEWGSVLDDCRRRLAEADAAVRPCVRR